MSEEERHTYLNNLSPEDRAAVLVSDIRPCIVRASRMVESKHKIHEEEEETMAENNEEWCGYVGAHVRGGSPCLSEQSVSRGASCDTGVCVVYDEHISCHQKLQLQSHGICRVMGCGMMSHM